MCLFLPCSGETVLRHKKEGLLVVESRHGLVSKAADKLQSRLKRTGHAVFGSSCISKPQPWDGAVKAMRHASRCDLQVCDWILTLL